MRRAWWVQRTFVIHRRHMTSVYLCPLLFFLGCLGIDTFAPLVPSLMVIGIITGVVFRLNHSNSSHMTMLSIVGHCGVSLPYLLRSSKDVRSTPSLCVIACVIGTYRALDIWPYCISPIEFITIASLLTFFCSSTL